MENVKTNHKLMNIIIITLTIIIIFSFFIGFYFEENSAGGGVVPELHHHWKNFQIFLNNDFLTAINLTKGGSDKFGMNYDSSRTPLVPIIQAFFLSFVELNQEFVPEELFNFRAVIFSISLMGPIIFYYCLKKKFTSTPKVLLILLPISVLFLSPYYRTSAFWGFAENYTFLSMLLSYFYYQKLIDFKKDQPKKNINFNLFLITFFSSLCVYFDVKAIIVPILCYFFILRSNLPIKSILVTTIYYLIFSLPMIYLFFLWKGPIPPTQMLARDAGFAFYIENIGYSISIISFYLLPLIFFKHDNFNSVVKLLTKKKFIIFSILSIFYIVFLNYFFDFSNQIFLGKGIIHKVIELLSENENLKILITNFAFIISIFIIVLFVDKKLDIFIILFFISFSCISLWLFQEYFDPIILIFAFTFFGTQLYITAPKVLLLTSYQSLFLISAIIYYN